MHIDTAQLTGNNAKLHVYCNNCINIIHNENMEELTDKLRKELINSGYTVNNYCSNCNKMIGSEMMQIKAIVDHTVSKRDINENCYWYCTITSTRTGKSIIFTTPHRSNTYALIMDINLDYGNTYCVETTLPIRQFNRLYKDISLHNTCMSEHISKAIKRIL